MDNAWEEDEPLSPEIPFQQSITPSRRIASSRRSVFFGGDSDSDEPLRVASSMDSHSIPLENNEQVHSSTLSNDFKEVKQLLLNMSKKIDHNEQTLKELQSKL